MIDIEAHRSATESLAALLRRDDDYLTERHAGQLARRLVAHALIVCDYLQPVREGDRMQLRQTAVNTTDSIEWWSEHAGHLKREYEDALAILERIRQGRMAEFDPDGRDQDRADDRAREARQDEAANENAPTAKGAA